LIEDGEEIDPAWFMNKARIGITAGASTPEILVQRVLDRLGAFGKLSAREMEGKQETMRFRLPKSTYL
jgi:4-hydroxy-3-methylbut-2-enyl diphosphate reductase